jgi:hypothetical protein
MNDSWVVKNKHTGEVIREFHLKKCRSCMFISTCRSKVNGQSRLTNIPLPIMRIGPGSSVDLVLHLDLLKETTEFAGPSYTIQEDNTYTLSRLNPPVKRSSIGMPYHITHLTTTRRSVCPLWFWRKIDRHYQGYRLNSFPVRAGIDLRRQSGLDMYDLRVHYRVRPGVDWSYSILTGVSAGEPD